MFIEIDPNKQFKLSRFPLDFHHLLVKSHVSLLLIQGSVGGFGSVRPEDLIRSMSSLRERSEIHFRQFGPGLFARRSLDTGAGIHEGTIESHLRKLDEIVGEIDHFGESLKRTRGKGLSFR